VIDTLSYQIMEFLSKVGVKHIFFVPGGGNMFLVDAAGRHPKIKTIATHNEQSAVISAEAYSRMTKNIGVALVTTGPGGTNAVTGIAGAWLDSIPLLVISGQVKIDDINFDNKLRQKGPQEINIVEIVKPITKKATLLKNSDLLFDTLSEIILLAKTGRPGPVLLDVPLDIQSKKIEFDINSMSEQNNFDKKISGVNYEKVFERLFNAKRPLILLGHGVKSSKINKILKLFLEENNIPVSLTWPMTDFFEFNNKLNAGRPGVVAKRSANFIIQKADFILSLGSRLDRIVTAFNPQNFGRNAEFFYCIDIDNNELEKLPERFIKINADVRDFVESLVENQNNFIKQKTNTWIKEISYLKNSYSEVELIENNEKLTCFEVVNELSKEIPENAKIVTGSSGLCVEVFYTHFNNKIGQEIFLTTGLGAMGFGLPALLGTCASFENEKIFLYESDGSLMMNLQELQTIKTYNYNATIFVMNNNGYASIRATQNNYFDGRLVGTSASSGLEIPNMEKLANCFGYNYININSKSDLQTKLKEAINSELLTLCEINLKEDEVLIPKCSVIQTKDNKLISAPIEDMSPLLSLNELKKIMGDQVDPISLSLRK